LVISLHSSSHLVSVLTARSLSYFYTVIWLLPVPMGLSCQLSCHPHNTTAVPLILFCHVYHVIISWGLVIPYFAMVSLFVQLTCAGSTFNRTSK
jgi:hypothetical protein